MLESIKKSLTFLLALSFVYVQAFAYDPKASQIKTKTTAFNGGLSTSDTDVQKALDTLDNASSVIAPLSATYITKTADSTLSGEFALGSLATGILKNTTTTGVPSIAVQGTDYYAPAGTDVAVVDGGTGSSTASGARTALGLVIGSDVQGYDADLTTYAGITPSANIQTLLGSATYSNARTNLGLAIGTDVQAYDADLADLADGSLSSTKVADLLLNTTDPYLTAVGKSAMTSTTGQFNTALGFQAGSAITTSTFNTYVGYNSGSGTAGVNTGIKNTALGASTLTANTSGTLNTALGYLALSVNTSGSFNTASGVDALVSNTIGSNNSAYGYLSLSDSVSGDSNSAFGMSSLDRVTTGSTNTAVGYRAGYSVFTGTKNIFLGNEAGFQGDNYALTNTILIGSQIYTNLSNVASFGNSSTTGFGFGAIPRTNYIELNGSADRTIGLERNPSNNTAGKSLTVSAGAPAQTGRIEILSTSPTAGGTGYTVGDILTISGGTSGTCIVNTVSGGVVTNIALLNKGTGYSIASGVATTGGTGTGCTVNITNTHSATNKAGGTLILASGVSTGTGTSEVQVQTPTAGSSSATDNALVTRATINSSGVLVTPPSAQTIAAGDIITADGCGTIKQITSAGAVTTSTTNTFTAPGATNTGCIMRIINIGSNNITLDNNANFKSASGADVVMTADDSVVVASNGTAWYQVSALLAN